MKIVHFTDVHPRHDARILLRQAVTLKEAGHEVILVTGDGKPDEYFKGVRITSYSDHEMTKKERFKLLFSKRKYVQYLLAFDADVYQFHDFELIEVGKKLKKMRCHVIFDSHENWLDLIPGYISKYPSVRKIFRSLMRRYYKRVVSRFDAVFSVSPNMVEEIKKFNQNTFMVPNFPSLKGFEEKASQEKENFFVYQGVVYGISNQGPIVNALSLLDQDVRYKIIGKMSPAVENEIKENDKAGRVDICGWIEKNELDNIMSKSLCGIVILDYVPTCCGREGQLGSNKIFEYMLCGLPVICTDFKLWRELIINKYHCGICVEPGNVEQITNAMGWILGHPQEAVEMGKRGREAVLKEFNWEAGLDDYLLHYDKICMN